MLVQPISVVMQLVDFIEDTKKTTGSNRTLAPVALRCWHPPVLLLAPRLPELSRDLEEVLENGAHSHGAGLA